MCSLRLLPPGRTWLALTVGGIGALTPPHQALAAPFGRGPLDHSLCCGRGNPAQHNGGDFAGDSPLSVTPGLELGADSGIRRNLRRTPASVPAPTAPAAADAAAPTAPMGKPPPAVPEGPPLAALEGPLEMVGGFAKIAYSQLAGFKFRPPPQPIATDRPPPDVLAQVPAAIRRLDGQKVVLTGYMLPLKLENGFATEFFFLASPNACCYGTVPEVNEWMLVKMRGEGLPPMQDVPLFLAGRLHLRARWDEGYLLGIYDLEGEGLLKMR